MGRKQTETTTHSSLLMCAFGWALSIRLGVRRKRISRKRASRCSQLFIYRRKVKEERRMFFTHSFGESYCLFEKNPGVQKSNKWNFLYSFTKERFVFISSILKKKYKFHYKDLIQIVFLILSTYGWNWSERWPLGWLHRSLPCKRNRSSPLSSPWWSLVGWHWACQSSWFYKKPF